jgi:hypothetical protein
MYYEHIQKLVRGLQAPTIDIFLGTIFRMGLQSSLRIVITRMK